MDVTMPTVAQPREATTKDKQAMEDRAIYRAIKIVNKRLREPGTVMNAPASVRDFLHLTLAGEERECFLVMLLDAQLRLIEFRVLFSGTLTKTMVYPREIVKFALLHNAAAAIIAHNHPSGIPEPSQADIDLTEGIKATLGMVDISLFDHMIVAKDGIVSLAERGLL